MGWGLDQVGSSRDGMRQKGSKSDPEQSEESQWLATRFPAKAPGWTLAPVTTSEPMGKGKELDGGQLARAWRRVKEQAA